MAQGVGVAMGDYPTYQESINIYVQATTCCGELSCPTASAQRRPHAKWPGAGLTAIARSCAFSQFSVACMLSH
eukprot:6208134-Pleurochrysis_carterae.AAC.2